MKIGIAQTRPVKGNIPENIDKHKRFVQLALSLRAEAIFFPELSLTGYEPGLAKDLAINKDDSRLDVFQQLSDANKITIGLGIPTRTDTGIRISMLIFQPGKSRQTYSKQQLHADEFSHFENGDRQVMVKVGNKKIAPAICFESLQPEHAERAFSRGAEVYITSVAKSESGVSKASEYYPEVAKKHSMPVLMSNCIGPCDNFVSMGGSAVWTGKGHLAAQLDERTEGVLVFDTETRVVIEQALGEN